MTTDRNVHIQPNIDVANFCDGLRIALEHLAQAAEQYLDTEHRDEARDLELRRNLGEAATDASLALHPGDPVCDQAECTCRLAAEPKETP